MVSRILSLDINLKLKSFICMRSYLQFVLYIKWKLSYPAQTCLANNEKKIRNRKIKCLLMSFALTTATRQAVKQPHEFEFFAVLIGSVSIKR